MSDVDRETYLCTHWLWHRLVAKGRYPYGEAPVIEDERALHGDLPAEFYDAVRAGVDDLTPWCPILNPSVVAGRL